MTDPENKILNLYPQNIFTYISLQDDEVTYKWWMGRLPPQDKRNVAKLFVRQIDKWDFIQEQEGQDTFIQLEENVTYEERFPWIRFSLRLRYHYYLLSFVKDSTTSIE